MPRARKPARLWLRPGDDDRAAVWIILDGGKQISTGCSALDRGGAESALERHIAKRFLAEPSQKDRRASEVTVAEVVAHYLAAKRKTAKRPMELAYRAERLLDWWGDRTLDDITSKTCEAYAVAQTTPAQARRQLEDLRAAIAIAVADGVTRQSVKVTLPPKPKGRVAHLERDVIAKLIWTAYRKREFQKGRATKKRPMLHVARFLLTALYTGSRSGRVWQASFVKEVGSPWIDLNASVFYRAWDGEAVAANKRAPPIRLPERLLAHMRRWRAKGARYVVEYQGRPADPKRAYSKLVVEVLGEKSGIVRHTLRHTAATWLMQAGVDPYEASGYLGMTLETLETTYGHHHPSHQAGVGSAFSSGKAGRVGVR